MSRILEKSLILDRIKKAYTLKSNAKLASFLGIPPTTLSSWYSRNTFDLDLIYEKCVEINLNWLLTGEGEMLRSEEKPEHAQHIQSKLDDSILYNIVQSLQEEKKEKEQKIEKLTEELRAMERKIGSLEAELRHAETLGYRAAETVSTKKSSSKPKVDAHSANAPLNE